MSQHGANKLAQNGYNAYQILTYYYNNVKFGRLDPAWKLYERKLVYLESKQPDISREFERFLKKYPKVMDAYVEYSIYLCRNNKMTQAQRVYREGRKRTGMTSKRAEELRRKLGL